MYPFDHLQTAVQDKNRALIGTPGYRLPDSGRLVRTEIGGGRNNVVYSRAGFSDFTFDIDPLAHDNVLIFDHDCTCAGRVVLRGSANLAVVWGASTGYQPINIHFFSRRGVFFFGDQATSNTTTFEIAGDDKSIVVGEDCMFSAFIDVTTDDRHGIFDFESGSHLNPPASVHFAPHVWVGLHATVLKGADIGFGSIIAARTLVSGAVPEFTSVGGVPSRVLRSGVSWTRATYPSESAMSQVRDAHQRLRRT